MIVRSFSSLFLLLLVGSVVAVLASQQNAGFSRRVFTSMSARAIEAVESYSITSAGNSDWHRMHGKNGVWSRHWSHHGIRSVVSTEHTYAQSVRFPFRTEGNIIQPYPDRITLAFTIFGESHEYELHIAHQLTPPSVIVQTKPGENHPSHSASYWKFFNDGRGSFITATVRPDGRFSAVLNKDGKTLQIDPTTEHRHEMEAEHLDAMEQHAPHGLVGYFHHDLHDLEKTHLCGSVEAHRVDRKKIEQGESADVVEHSHTDNRIVLGPRRNLLAIDVFDDSCYPNKATQAKKLSVGVATDAGLCRIYGCSVQNVEAAVKQIYSTMNAVYSQQINVYLEINEFQIRLDTSTQSTETWNKDTGGLTRKPSGAQSTCGDSYTIETDLNSFSGWRGSVHKNKYGEWHKLTDCFPAPGTVGLAWVGVLCMSGSAQGSSTGVSSQSSSFWLTIAHEIGHNFAASHTFQLGQGATGGIMDYGDGRNPPKTGDYQFNKVYSQSEMCGEISSTLNTKGITPYCWANFIPECGNGRVEPGETCDDKSNPCCDQTTCQLISGAQCSEGPCCDIDPNSKTKCMYKPSTTLCSNGNGYCANGACTSSSCSQYSNLGWGQGKCTFLSSSGGCSLECQYNGQCLSSGLSGVNMQVKDGTVCSTSPYSVCKSGKCTQTTAPTLGPGGGGSTTSAPTTATTTTTAAQGTTATGTTTRTTTTTTTTTTAISPISYTWSIGSWGTCTNGQQTRTVQCTASVAGFTTVVADSSCVSSSGGKPATSQACAIYQWVPNDTTSGWGACSVDCGSGGVQTRTVSCNDISYTTTVTAPSQSLCTATKPITQRSCPSTTACPAQWQYGGWTTCSASCGPGTQTRTATCFMTQNGRLISTTEQYCIDNGAGQKGATSQSCQIVACATYNWVYGQWSSCSKSCGGGSQTRTATCTQTNGDGSTSTAAESQCTATKQATSQVCNTDLCPVYAWKTSDWGACSVTCGGGSQTRTVECWNTAPEPDEKVFDYYCTTAKPAMEQSCNTNVCPIYQWRYTVWGACSKTCGGGTQTRSAICHDIANYPLSGCDANSATCTGDSSDATKCSSGNKEATSQSCNSQPCATYDWKLGDWSSCSKSCGGGSQSRSVQCVSNSGTVVADSTCTTTKPTSTQSCNNDVCIQYNWFTADWSACSVACGIGGGTRTRSVVCRSSTDQTVADSQCTATKPATSEVCNNFKCNSFWYTSAWSGCTANCGGGTATRTVDCRLVSDDKTPNSGAGTCTDAQPSTTAPCNTEPCPTWVSGAWSPCNVRCGTGQQNRTNVCTRYDGTIAPFSECTANTQPITVQICTVDPCPHWHRDPWGECDRSCGGGVRTRTITCRMPHDLTYGGRAVSDKTLCPADMASGSDQGDSTDLVQGLPVTEETCNVQACDTYYWKATWSACSQTCGGGVSTATYACVNSRTEQVQTGANERLCTAAKPSEAKDLSRACNTFECAYYQWISQDWQSCLGKSGESLICGPGTQKRSVVCGNTKVAVDPTRYNVTYDVVADSLCASQPKPSTEQSCSAPSDSCYGSVPGETNGACTSNGTCSCRIGYGGVDCKINPSISGVKSNAATYTKGVPLGESIIISWSSGGSIPTVSILLMKDTWETPVYIEKDVPNKGSYVWSVGSGLIDATQLGSGDGYTIQVYFSAKVNANSEAFTIAPPCAYVSCGVHGECSNGACQCSPGYLGSTCQESVCASKCVEKNTATCDASTNFECQCKDGWTGNSCATPTASKCPKCVNGDYPPNTIVDFDLGCPACQCPTKSFFIGDLCDTCFLQCGTGKQSSNCTVCVDCGAGYFGRTCSCRYYEVAMKLQFTADSKLYDLSWINSESSSARIKQTIVQDILAAAGLPSSRIQLSVDSFVKDSQQGAVIATFRLNRPCASIQVQKNGFHLLSNKPLAVPDEDESLASLWKGVRTLFQYADSDVYKSGVLTRNIDTSFGIKVTDPTKIDAPASIEPNSVKDRFDDARNNNGYIPGTEPQPEGPATSASSSPNWILIGGAIGGGLALILIIVLAYFCVRNRSTSNKSLTANPANYMAKPPTHTTPVVPGHTSNPSIQLMANPAISGAKSLPPFWSEHQTDAGQTYFYNSRTGVTQWDRPTA